MRESIVITGTVRWYDKNKGYGFIARHDGRKDVFVHRNYVIGRGTSRIRAGQKVRFDVREGRYGPSTALNVRLI
jgi:CspA family cold shock protein